MTIIQINSILIITVTIY